MAQGWVACVPVMPLANGTGCGAVYIFGSDPDAAESESWLLQAPAARTQTSNAAALKTRRQCVTSVMACSWVMGFLGRGVA